jgi:hypothetical protein
MAKRSSGRGNKQLKPRQMAFVKNLADGMTITAAARSAGYSRKCPGQSGYQALQNLKLRMPELLDRLGLSDVALIEKHLKPLLSARTTKFFQYRGKVTGKRLVLDNDARLRALELAFKLKGSFVEVNPKLAEDKDVRVIIMDAPRPPRPVASAASTQLSLAETRSTVTEADEHANQKAHLGLKPKFLPNLSVLNS